MGEQEMRVYLKKALLIAIAMQICALSAVAQGWVGVPTGVIIPFSQDNTQWCWASGSSFLLSYYLQPYGLSVSQESVVMRAHGNLANLPGSDADITYSLNTYTTLGNGSNIFFHGSELPGMLAPQILYNNLVTGHPVLVAIASGPTEGHIVVITAAYFVPSANGLMVPSIVYRDPSPMYAFMGGRMQVDGPAAAQFVSLVRSSWVTWTTQ
jgi:hypothetical protein